VSPVRPERDLSVKPESPRLALRSGGGARVDRLITSLRPAAPTPVPTATPDAIWIADMAVTAEKAPIPAVPTPEAPRVPRPEVAIAVPEAATRVAANDAAEASSHSLEPVRGRNGFKSLTLAGSGTGHRAGGDLINVEDAKAQVAVVRNFGSIVGSRGTSGL
jgi:hypothetical protein